MITFMTLIAFEDLGVLIIRFIYKNINLPFAATTPMVHVNQKDVVVFLFYFMELIQTDI